MGGDICRARYNIVLGSLRQESAFSKKQVKALTLSQEYFTIKYLNLGLHKYYMKEFENRRRLLWQDQKKNLGQVE
jgi:hypothetical protein